MVVYVKTMYGWIFKNVRVCEIHLRVLFTHGIFLEAKSLQLDIYPTREFDGKNTRFCWLLETLKIRIFRQFEGNANLNEPPSKIILTCSAWDSFVLRGFVLIPYWVYSMQLSVYSSNLTCLNMRTFLEEVWHCEIQLNWLYLGFDTFLRISGYKLVWTFNWMQIYVYTTSDASRRLIPCCMLFSCRLSCSAFIRLRQYWS